MNKPLARGSASDTIFAMASGMGRGAISIMRVSGPACRPMAGAVCGRLPRPRLASLRRLRDGRGGLIDRALVLWFPGPGSYTGEDVVEFHLHGGPAVQEAVTATLLRLGARPADPGEFTRRAFLTGKMDLLAAEAVADLIDAETAEQRQLALRQMSGEQGRLVQDWSRRLTQALAWQEALIDFSDDDPQPSLEAETLQRLQALVEELDRNIRLASQGERLRRGLTFVISGPPNVGKSSLLNALAGRDVAIVAPHPGTTRDALHVGLVVSGISVTLVDTAGLRQTDDDVEAEGVRRALAHAESADLVIEMIEAANGGPCACDDENKIYVANKVDLADPPCGFLGISVRAGTGMTDMMAAIESAARRLAYPATDAVFTRARHSAALRDAHSHVAAAITYCEPELRAEELRLALRDIGRIAGRVETEAVLDDVFSSFCIGK